MSTCLISDCDRRLVAHGWCDTHYRNWRRHGTPIAPPRPKRGTCDVHGCGLPTEAMSLCHKHYTQMRRKGAPEAVTPREAENSHTWSGDQVGYSGAHKRIVNTLGPARDQTCVDCRGPARHWAYDHGDPNAITDPLGRGRYSLNPAFYMAMCSSCHKRFDTRHRRLAA